MTPEQREDRIARIRETLHPTRRHYCAEPISIEDAQWLLACLAVPPPPVEDRHPLQQLLDEQQALGPADAKVLYDNLWALYDGQPVEDTRSLTPAWQPIATAPKDGTQVLLFWKGNIAQAAWVSDWAWWEVSGWRENLIVARPTHWMPLPAAPTAREDQ